MPSWFLRNGCLEIATEYIQLRNFASRIFRAGSELYNFAVGIVRAAVRMSSSEKYFILRVDVERLASMSPMQMEILLPRDFSVTGLLSHLRPRGRGRKLCRRPMG